MAIIILGSTGGGWGGGAENLAVTLAAGNLTGGTPIEAAGALELGTVTATSVVIGRAGQPVTIDGDLTVNGTTTVINAANLSVADQLILLSDGADPGVSSGLAVERGATGLDALLFWNETDDRFEFGFFNTVAGTTVPGASLSSAGTLANLQSESFIAGRGDPQTTYAAGSITSDGAAVATDAGTGLTITTGAGGATSGNAGDFLVNLGTAAGTGRDGWAAVTVGGTDTVTIKKGFDSGTYGAHLRFEGGAINHAISTNNTIWIYSGVTEDFTRDGGSIELWAGADTTAAGRISIGSPGTGTTFNGGDVDIFGGDGVANGGSATAGTVHIEGGAATDAGVRGGDVEIYGGLGSSDTAGPKVTILGGENTNSGTSATGGDIELRGGKGANSTTRPSGSIIISGGGGNSPFPSANHLGGSVTITSGAGGATGGNSGALTLDVGAAPGTGNPGDLGIGTTNAGNIAVGHSSALIGFYGVTPVVRSAAYTRNATVVEDRTLLASTSATTTNNNNVLAALIADLQAIGILG